MAISDQITRLQNAKKNIKTAIETKGVTVPEETTIDGYSALINEITAGGGQYQIKSVVPAIEAQVITPDYGYDALEEVTVEATPLESVDVTPNGNELVVKASGENIGLERVIIAGDANLSPENVKSGIMIYGVMGEYEGSIEVDGDVTSGTGTIVQAQSDLYEGDLFMGTPTESAGASLVKTTISTRSIAGTNDSGSVVVFEQTIASDSSIILIGIKNGETSYEEVEVALPSDMGGITSLSLTKSSYRIIMINENGSAIIIPFTDSTATFGKGLLMIRVNRTLKTGFATYIRTFSGGSGITVGSWTDGYVSDFTGTGAVFGNYYATIITIRYRQGALATFGLAVYSFSTTTGSFSSNPLKILAMSPQGLGVPDQSKIGRLSNGMYVISTGRQFYQLSTTDEEVKNIVLNSSYPSDLTISSNARYCCSEDYGNIYRLDFSSGTVTSLGNIRYAAHIDDTGRYVITKSTIYGSNIIRVSDGVTILSNVPSCYAPHFGITNDDFYISGQYKCYMSYSGTQYVASLSNGDATTTGKVYGVIKETIEQGKTGKALVLFTT